MASLCRSIIRLWLARRARAVQGLGSAQLYLGVVGCCRTTVAFSPLFDYILPHLWVCRYILDLRARADDRSGTLLSLPAVLGWMADTASGLDRMHHGGSEPFLHRDIKPENMFVFEGEDASAGTGAGAGAGLVLVQLQVLVQVRMRVLEG